ncbi:2035_t:CDS:2, partial [Racocetra persica]
SAHCINTMANMGLCTTYQITFNKINGISNEYYNSVNKYVQDHVDDYHNLHGTHIPSTNSAKQIVHMATILFNTIRYPPISYNSVYGLPVHNPQGVDAFLLKTISQKYIFTLANSYNLEKSNWSWVSNKTNLIENLTIHSYNADIAQ